MQDRRLQPSAPPGALALTHQEVGDGKVEEEEVALCAEAPVKLLTAVPPFSFLSVRLFLLFFLLSFSLFDHYSTPPDSAHSLKTILPVCVARLDSNPLFVQ